MSAASIKAAAAKKRSSGSTANKNYATSLAGGGSVTVKDGVKTYSDKPLQVTGNNGISISGKSYSRNKGGTGFAPAVSATDIGTDSPTLPVQEYGKDTGPINLSGSPVLSENGISISENQYVYDPKVSENMNAVNQNAFSNQALLDSYMGKVTDAYDQTKNMEADYLKREKQAGIQKFQQQVNDYTSEINSIVKNRDAAMLSLEGQGRGQTQGFIGGEQARINREAAIAALPVQAQLDAAQGNLTSATARLDKLFAIHQQDIQNEFNFKTSLAKSVFDFGTAAQQNILTAKMADIKAATDLAMANSTYSKDLQKQALENGQADLLSQFATIDPKSPTFEQDIAKVASQLKDPMLELQQEQVRASIAASYQSISESKTSQLIDLAKMGDKEALAQLGITLDDNSTPTSDEIGYAQQYASTGQIPTGLTAAGVSFGRIAEIAKDLPKPDGAIVDSNTGVAPSNLSDGQKQGIVAMSEIVQQTLPRMNELWQKAQMTNLGGTGIVGGVSSKLIPSQAMTEYLQARDEFLSKLLVARSGAAVTEQEYTRYAALVPSAFNNSLFLGSSGDTKLNGLQTLMSTDLDNKLNSNQLTIYGYSTVDAGGQQYKVGEVITNEYGQKGIVQPDGQITPIQ